MKNHIKILFLMAITFITVFVSPINIFAGTRVILSDNEYIDLTSYESIEIVANTPWAGGCTSTYFPSGTMGASQSTLTATLIDSRGQTVQTLSIGGKFNAGIPISYSGMTNPTSGYFDVSGLSGEYKITVTGNTVSMYDYDGTTQSMLTHSATSSIKKIVGNKYDFPEISGTNLAK